MSVFAGVRYALATNLQPEIRIALRQLLEQDGATSAPLPEATHVVTSSPDFDGREDVAEGAFIVSKEWVDRSVVLERMQPPEVYSPDPAKIFSGVVACATELPASETEVLSAGITALGGSWRPALTKEITHLFALAPGSEKYRIALHYANQIRIKVVHPQWFDDSIRFGTRALTNAYEWPDPLVLAAERDGPSTASMARKSSLDPVKDVWKGRRIFFSPDLELHDGRRETLEITVGQHGGTVVASDDDNDDGMSEGIFDILVARYRWGSSYVQAVRSGKLVGTLAWFFLAQFSGSFTQATENLSHYPIPRNPIDGFLKHKITVTNFQGAVRDYLKRLIELAGATFTPSMSGENTAVIAASLSGTKADKARSWGIPVVTMAWLEDCFIVWTELSMAEERYTSIPVEVADDAPPPVMAKLDRDALLEEVSAIAEDVEVERRMKQLAKLSVRDAVKSSASPPGEELPVSSMDVDRGESPPAADIDTPADARRMLLRRAEKRRAVDLSSDDAGGVESISYRPRRRRKSSATSPPESDPASPSASPSAVEEMLGSRVSRSRSSSWIDTTSPSPVHRSPTKRKVSVVLPAPRSAAKRVTARQRKKTLFIPDLEESDDEELLAGLQISPRKPKRGTLPITKGRLDLTSTDESEPDLPSAVRTPAKVDKGKRRADPPDGAQQVSMLRLTESPHEPMSARISAKAVTTYARRVRPTKPKSPEVDSEAHAELDASDRAESHRETSSVHATDAALLSSMGRSRRTAATKATQRLHDEIMPDVLNFEKELRRGNVRAIGEKEREAEARARAKENKAAEKRRRTSELAEGEDEMSEPEAKKRKLGAKGKERAKQPLEATENALVESSQPSIRIVTTGYTLPDNINRKLHQLGIRTVANVRDCTHLIVNRIARTEKFLCAMAVAPVIVDERWAQACASENKILPADSEEYRLRDRETEKKYGFKLSDALRRAKENDGQLFEDMIFFVTQKVSIDFKLLKNVVLVHGGKIKQLNPTARMLEGKEDYYVVSCPEDISIWRPIAEAGHTIYTTELILTSALVQEIRWKDPAFILQ